MDFYANTQLYYLSIMPLLIVYSQISLNSPVNQRFSYRDKNIKISNYICPLLHDKRSEDKQIKRKVNNSETSKVRHAISSD